MKMKIEIDMRNAAFIDAGRVELIWIISDVVTHVQTHGFENKNLLDSNGNPVGKLNFK